jgi:dihydrolipoamide dehydrogenase
MSTDGAGLRRRGVEIIKADARFLSSHELEAGVERLQADSFILATGSEPAIPAIEGLEETGCWTSRDAIFPDRQPEALAVIGGSAAGCELAQIYARLGTRVTIIERMPHLLPGSEVESSLLLEDVMEKEGITLHLKAEVDSFSSGPEGKTVSFTQDGSRQSVAADEVLMATGRKAALGGLGLDEAGVSTTEGAIGVDRNLRTSRPHIWACGDAIGGLMHSHVAVYESDVAGRNSVRGEGAELLETDYTVMPSAVFTDPPVASVGITEEQAMEQGLDILVGRSSFTDSGRAVAMGEARGTAKIIAGAADRRLLGAHVTGPGADMMIHEAVIAMGSGLGADALLRPRAIHIHPTLSEVMGRAAAALS